MQPEATKSLTSPVVPMGNITIVNLRLVFQVVFRPRILMDQLAPHGRVNWLIWFLAPIQEPAQHKRAASTPCHLQPNQSARPIPYPHPTKSAFKNPSLWIFREVDLSHKKAPVSLLADSTCIKRFLSCNPLVLINGLYLGSRQKEPLGWLQWSVYFKGILISKLISREHPHRDRCTPLVFMAFLRCSFRNHPFPWCFCREGDD